MTSECKVEELYSRDIRTADGLHQWIQTFVGLNIPRRAICPHHDPPFEYLIRSFFEPASDLIVWAPRGGGKTRLAAVATLLDLVFKPGCSVRILGGSLEQSLRMWEHLLPDLEFAAPHVLHRKRSSTRRVSLTNGSGAAVLTQSQRAVRGLRVQKLRCDEVELFKPEIWEAAQLVTKSRGPETRFVHRGRSHRGALDGSSSVWPDEHAHRAGSRQWIAAHHPLVPDGSAGAMRAGARVRDLSAVGRMSRCRENPMQWVLSHRRCDRDEAAREPGDVEQRDALPQAQPARVRVPELRRTGARDRG
jgi:hypothetical protein